MILASVFSAAFYSVVCDFFNVVLLFFFFFFFSSRRRHTRCSRDWSSDVCSSELTTYVRSLIKECLTGAIVECGIQAPAARESPRRVQRRALGGVRCSHPRDPRSHDHLVGGDDPISVEIRETGDRPAPVAVRRI